MQFLRVPAPFPSTILSLSDSEQFSYRGTRISAITITPNPEPPAGPYELSGEKHVLLPDRLKVYNVHVLPERLPALVRSTATQELSRYAPPAPSLRAVPQHPDAQATQTQTQTQRLAAPGPAPTVSQQHAIRANAHLTPALPPTAPARPGPGKHRA